MAMKTVAVALAILALLFLAGCARNNYVPCCVKDKLHDATTGTLECYYPDGTHFGSCDSESAEDGTASCTADIICAGKGKDACEEASPGCKWDGSCSPSSCGDIKSDEQCARTSNCAWNTGTSACEGPGQAYWMMPVCVDDAPKSCINDRCTAMMCGYTSTIAAPPPASQDWDASSPGGEMPQSASDLPSINLQATSCQFETMNRKLYNKVTNSRGSLWVNAFRFGVGSSFSDYEQSKYFFPESDRECGINTRGTIDRFTTYLNAPSTWCAPNPYYACSKNGLNFTSTDTCRLYCENDPADCQPGSGQQYACAQDNFAYASEEMCKSQCNVIDDPSLCTNDDSVAPFLESDTRYRMKYVADYMVESGNYNDEDKEKAFYATCRNKGGSVGQYSVGYWDPDHHYDCCDFAGWTEDGLCHDEDAIDGPWHYWIYDEGGTKVDDAPMRTYFENHKFAQLDFDYDYYLSKLEKQYVDAGADPDLPYAFECKNSVECISGACDMQNHKRSLCKADNGKGTVDCGCRQEKVGQSLKPTLVCEGLYPTSAFFAESGRKTITGKNIAVRVSGAIFTSDQEFSRNSDVNFHYYSLYDASNTGLKPLLFDRCEVQPAPTIVEKCVYGEPTLDGWNIVITDPINGGANCPYYPVNPAQPRPFYFYDITFNSSTPTLGICSLTNQRTESPYLDILDLGWCAGCTYSTMAVQKITWGPMEHQRGGACYEWRGERNYTVEDGADSDLERASLRDIEEDWAGNQFNGPITRGPWQDNFYYTCEDGWAKPGGSLGWWGNSPNPSAPFLRDKLTSYLQSNVMPILDERGTNAFVQYSYERINGNCDSGGSSGIGWECDLGGGTIYQSYPSCVRSCYSYEAVPITSYYPIWICSEYGGDGAAVHVIGNSSMLSEPQQIYDKTEGLGDDLMVDYLGVGTHLFETGDYYTADGTASLVVRASIMKEQCPHEPLVAMAIGESETLANLIGEPENYNPGELHKFFFNPNYEPWSYDQRVARAIPDKYPDRVDLLLQEWYPLCSGGGSLEEKVEREVSAKMEFSRALLSNLSKPSIIWKFHFPDNSQCGQMTGGKKDYGYFLSYLFNNTGAMVDAGMLGLIYDSWMTADGRGYGAETETVTSQVGWHTESVPLSTGLTDTLAEGRLDDYNGAASGKTSTPFCELQRYSAEVLGLVKYTYGQKLYSQEGACACTPCTESDYTLGLCEEFSAPPGQDIPQQYCNDGNACEMPPGHSDYENYKCPSTCVSAEACLPCSSFSSQSFCRIEEVGSAPQGVSKPYSEISDTYWEFLAGLPASAKCCLVSQEPNKPLLEYTYVAREGSKQQSEFLQYPTRGESGIDCGRSPDTSVLKYCNVAIPISQKQISCFQTG